MMAGSCRARLSAGAASHPGARAGRGLRNRELAYDEADRELS
jgi:hypothetical protein